jgi:recombinational DNA repair protein (RecF pathway)
MAQPFLVLRLESSGESFLKVHLLGPEDGLFLCMKRVSKKGPSNQPVPDLFDTAEVSLETSKQGTMQFVRDYHPIVRRTQIGRNYRRLQRASEFSQLLVLNAAHMPDLPTLYQLVARSLDAFSQRSTADVVFLKSVFLLLKEEGYPVHQSWWSHLPPTLRAATKPLIEQPSPDALDPETQRACLAAIQHLLNWLRRETELILPEGLR